MKIEYYGKSNAISKVILLIIFIPVALFVIFIALPIVFGIVCLFILIMFLTRGRFSNWSTFLSGKRKHYSWQKRNCQSAAYNNIKKDFSEQKDFYDAKFVSLDDEECEKK